MEMETFANRSMYCNNPTMVNSHGMWEGKNPLRSSVPLLLAQLILISLTSKAAEICLRPLGQSSIVCQILGGVILGPSVLGKASNVAATLFPQRGNVIIETLSTFGLVLFLFSIGVKMDASLMFKPEKIALSISMSLFIFTLIIPLSVTIAIMNTVNIESELRKSLPLLVGSQSLVAFPAIACLLAELKIFNTEVGRLAVATSMFYDLLVLSTCAFGFAYFETQEEGFLRSMAAIMSILGFIVSIVVMVRYLLLRFLVPYKETKSAPSTSSGVNEVQLSIIFVVLFISTLLSEIVGQHYFLGPVVLGLAIPNSSPLGAAVVSKLDTFVSGLLYPTFLAIGGLKTDIFSIGFRKSWQTGIIVFAGVAVKFAAVMIPAMYGDIPFKESFVRGLVMNTRGINELIIYNLVLEDKKISGQDFTVLVLSAALVTAIISPLVKFFYGPSRRYVPVSRMTIQHHKKDREMKMVVCVHQHNNVPTLVDVLEASGALKEALF
uniref:Cation/H+ exchanger transmembrane domain-containing protein n=1 Tax=Chenopodium quinoa TaxID=63459 RepID=A0A803M414_CHEQI